MGEMDFKQTLQVLKEKKHIFVRSDFLLASDEYSVVKIILDSVGQILAELLPLHEKAYQSLKEFMSSLRPRLLITDKGPKVEFLMAR